MKLSKDDPRLTAYALGEITDPTERVELKSAIESDPRLKAQVEEIREMSGLLSESLAFDEAPELSEFEKETLGKEPATVSSRSSTAPGLGKLLRLPILSAGIAAIAVFGLLLVVPVGSLFQGSKEDAQVDIVTLEAPELSEPAKVNNLVGSKETNADKKLQTPQRQPELEMLEDVSVAQEQTLSANIPAPASKLEGRTREVRKDAGGAITLQTFSVAGMPPPPPAERDNAWNTEQYDMIEETGFRSPLVAPLSTFSIDVDTASYANVRRFLNQGQMPPADAVRIEELINYFPYSDAAPTVSIKEGGDPFAVHMEQAIAPWNDEHRLLRVALKGYLMPWDERPASNLVFLLDVSGSMNQPNKLPLLKKAMDLLVRRLDGRDRVAIVVYAGASGLVLPSTSANNHATIEHAFNQLAAGGSTNAGAGIQLAYKVALDNFIEEGNNRVILCTDGDFNVGQTNRGSLADVAEEHADKGVSLTVLGFGMGNYKDGMLETLSNKGKGSYAYVDSESEARKVFLEDLTSNLFKIAKDVKIQVEFNPAEVKAYRLIGYENRRLKAEDFNNDAKKAGDIGPGHSVVAFYELVPTGGSMDLPEVDPLKYQPETSAKRSSEEIATVKLRYKLPDEDTSKLISESVKSSDLKAFAKASADLRFGAAVAAFGMRLSESGFIGDFPYREIESIAAGALDSDPGGHRSEFTGLVGKAESFTKQDEGGPENEYTVKE